MELNRDDRIIWTRQNKRTGKTLKSIGDVIRNVKNKKPGEEKVMIVLDSMVRPTTVLASEITKVSR